VGGAYMMKISPPFDEKPCQYLASRRSSRPGQAVVRQHAHHQAGGARQVPRGNEHEVCQRGRDETGVVAKGLGCFGACSVALTAELNHASLSRWYRTRGERGGGGEEIGRQEKE